MMKNKHLKNILIIVFWLAFWKIASMIVGYQVLLASPESVLKKFIAFLGMKDFWLSIGMSLFKIMLGFLSGMLLGSALAFVGAKFSFVH